MGAVGLGGVPEPLRGVPPPPLSHSVQEAIDDVTQWMASNETHKDLARQYVFRGELHAIGCDWEASMGDYEQALATMKRTLLQKSEALLRRPISESANKR